MAKKKPANLKSLRELKQWQMENGKGDLAEVRKERRRLKKQKGNS